MSDGAPVLAVEGLRTAFGPVRAVDGVSFSVRRGETLCIVGESGSGKSATALSIMGLIPRAAGKVVDGTVRLAGRGDLRRLDETSMAEVRGRDIGMVFQEPMSALNPVFRIGSQIGEPLRVHRGLSRREAHERAVELLAMVGVPSPAQRALDYPHQLSGGMRQRAVIAMAIACEPALILADEPTTALDVTIQAQILALFEDLQDRLGVAMVFITHDLRVVAEIADQVCVMYAGVVVEQGAARDVLRNPLHPYTQGLLGCVPRAGAGGTSRRLNAIPGTVPSLAALPQGCRFRSRCPHAVARCAEEEPPLLHQGGDGRASRCWLTEAAA